MSDAVQHDALVNELLGHLDMVQELPLDTPEQRRVALRAALNVRPPGPISPEALALHDRLLAAEAAGRGSVDFASLPCSALDERLVVWRGDITTLRAGAIVNAANSALLGCFVPLHGCVDNAIHSAAGLMLREDCAAIMAERGRPEPTGTATITPGHHLPAEHVIHTVGPIVNSTPNDEHRRLLASCYRSCLRLAADEGLASIAFCCISTGVFGYPKAQAADLAVATAREVLPTCPSIKKVVFCVYGQTDERIYRELLGDPR